MPTTYSDLICEGPCGVIWRPRPPRGWQNTKSDASPARVPLSSADPPARCAVRTCSTPSPTRWSRCICATTAASRHRQDPPARRRPAGVHARRDLHGGREDDVRAANARPTCTRPARSSRPPPEVRRRRRAALRPPGRRLHLQLPRSVGPDLAVELFLLEAPGAGHSPDGVTAWSRPNPVAPTAMG
jgi:hypothetical protein